jgi:uncharacterized protein
MTPQTGEVALITGASSGIGAAIARALSRRGAECILVARREDRLAQLKAELEAGGGRATVIVEDLADPASPQRLYDEVRRRGLEVSILVNNAGFGAYGRVLTQTPERLGQMLQLNLVSLTMLTRLFAADMVQRRRGRVLQVSSIGAYQPSPYYAVYSATKTYVLYASEALNWELRGTGVTVTTLCPGLTATEFHEVAEHIKPRVMDRVTMSAASVAEIGLRAMEKGKAVATPGLVNLLAAWSIKLIPRSWATALAGLMMKSRKVA